ncbi:MAG: deoxynucleoside kinase [Oscillospiraceae bacterium]|jgi:dTMP kinase|nr:deoxynucleoside kinase [Oscillospiraceae bacterium]
MYGKLIVIEGLDGSGKATQTALLAKSIENLKEKVFSISFPDYNEPSSDFVKIYLNSELGNDPEAVNAFAASSFYAIDRYVSFVKFWKNKYESGYTIIADRYTTSNSIYQLAKFPKTLWDNYLLWLEDYEYDKLKLPRPHLVIYLDVPVEVSQKLMLKRYNGIPEKMDLHEKNVNFLNSCRVAALYTAKKMGWFIINCCDENNQIISAQEIHSTILKIL